MLSFGIKFNLYQKIPGKETFRKHYGEKEKKLVNSIFSFSHNVFYLLYHKNQNYGHINFVVSKCFEFGTVTSKILLFWKRVNALILDKSRIFMPGLEYIPFYFKSIVSEWCQDYTVTPMQMQVKIRPIWPGSLNWIYNTCSQPITRWQDFRLVQIETNCRRHFKVHLKWKKKQIG